MFSFQCGDEFGQSIIARDERGALLLPQSLPRLLEALNDPDVGQRIYDRFVNGPTVPPTPPDPYHPGECRRA